MAHSYIMHINLIIVIAKIKKTKRFTTKICSHLLTLFFRDWIWNTSFSGLYTAIFAFQFTIVSKLRANEFTFLCSKWIWIKCRNKMMHKWKWPQLNHSSIISICVCFSDTVYPINLHPLSFCFAFDHIIILGEYMSDFSPIEERTKLEHLGRKPPL